MAFYVRPVIHGMMFASYMSTGMARHKANSTKGTYVKYKINRRYLEQNYSNMISNVLNNRLFPRFRAYQNRNRDR